jgi:hypothetical protein
MLSIRRCLAGVAMMALSAACHAGYTYSFSVNGGEDILVNPLTEKSPKGYYNFFRDRDGFDKWVEPGFDAMATNAVFWLSQWNGNLSLGLMIDFPSASTDTGRAFFRLSGLPQGWRWVLLDDIDEINGPKDRTPQWAWDLSVFPDLADGGLIRNLADSPWSIDWELKRLKGVDHWYFLSEAGAHDIDALAFDLARFDVLSIHSVPEPGVLALVGLGVVGLRSTRRKR